MPKAMTEKEIDPIAEEVDQQMMETGEEVGIPDHKVDLSGQFGDLSDGGRVGRARITPVGESGRVIFDKEKREPGRPTVRNVWRWDGAPSTIPLAYEPSGKRHDGGRKYLLKRYCTVCNYAGFYGQVCPQCEKAGRDIAPPLAAYYLKKEQVPKPQHFFGNVNCFVPVCVRHGKFAFLNEDQMREHAMSKHPREYRAHQDSQRSEADKELVSLRETVNILMKEGLEARNNGNRYERTEEQRQLARERMARARAARGKAKVA